MIKYIVIGLVFQGIYSGLFIIAANIILNSLMKIHKEAYKECLDKLKVRSGQVDVLMETVKELNLMINGLKSCENCGKFGSKKCLNCIGLDKWEIKK